MASIFFEKLSGDCNMLQRLRITSLLSTLYRTCQCVFYGTLVWWKCLKAHWAADHFSLVDSRSEREPLPQQDSVSPVYSACHTQAIISWACGDCRTLELKKLILLSLVFRPSSQVTKPFFDTSGIILFPSYPSPLQHMCASVTTLSEFSTVFQCNILVLGG